MKVFYAAMNTANGQFEGRATGDRWIADIEVRNLVASGVKCTVAIILVEDSTTG